MLDKELLLKTIQNDIKTNGYHKSPKGATKSELHNYREQQT